MTKPFDIEAATASVKKISDWVGSIIKEATGIQVPTSTEAISQAKFAAADFASKGSRIGFTAAMALAALEQKAKDREAALAYDRDNLIKVLTAIAEGYPVKYVDDGQVVVENPTREEDGHTTFLVLDLDETVRFIRATKKSRI